MKIIDRNGRLFGKISIIDVAVILVVAVLAAALGFKGNQTHTGTTSSNIPITFQLRVNGVRNFVADAVREGDNLYDLENSSGGPLGEILSIEVLPGTKVGSFSDGTIVDAPVEDGVTLLLTVQGKGIINNNRYLLNRVYNLGVNTTRNYYTPYAQFTATVTSVSAE